MRLVLAAQTQGGRRTTDTNDWNLVSRPTSNLQSRGVIDITNIVRSTTAYEIILSKFLLGGSILMPTILPPFASFSKLDCTHPNMSHLDHTG